MISILYKYEHYASAYYPHYNPKHLNNFVMFVLCKDENCVLNEYPHRYLKDFDNYMRISIEDIVLIFLYRLHIIVEMFRIIMKIINRSIILIFIGCRLHLTAKCLG